MTSQGSFGWLKVGDPRNASYLMKRELQPSEKKPKRESKMWSPGTPVDQGDSPCCVGFAGLNWQLASPTMDRIEDVVTGTVLYEECKKIDGNPDEDGTTTNALMQVLRTRGMIEKWVWAYDVPTVKAWVLSRGPLFLGSYWFDGMMQPDSKMYVRPTGESVGGHETLIVGYNHERDEFAIKNSWGREWGHEGVAYIKSVDIDKLLRMDGEAAGAVETGWAKKGV